MLCCSICCRQQSTLSVSEPDDGALLFLRWVNVACDVKASSLALRNLHRPASGAQKLEGQRERRQSVVWYRTRGRCQPDESVHTEETVLSPTRSLPLRSLTHRSFRQHKHWDPQDVCSLLGCIFCAVDAGSGWFIWKMLSNLVRSPHRFGE